MKKWIKAGKIKAETYKPIPGVDFPIPKDGKDANEAKIIGEILKQIPKPKNGKDAILDEAKIIKEISKKIPIPHDGQDGSPDTPEEVKNKLESLKGEDRLDASAIKNLLVSKGRGGGLKALIGGPPSAKKFTQLEDVPSSYGAQSGKVLTVKSSENGVEFTSVADVSGFTEAAQDAVGAMVSDSSSVKLTYTDATPTLAASLDLTNPNAWTGQQYFSEGTLTDGATIDWNLNTQQAAKVTLGGNRTMAAPTNIKAGGTYTLFIIQDATGSRTITWNAVFKWPGGTAPTLSTGASAVDIVTFISNGTNLYGAKQLNFS